VLAWALLLGTRNERLGQDAGGAVRRGHRADPAAAAAARNLLMRSQGGASAANKRHCRKAPLGKINPVLGVIIRQ